MITSFEVGTVFKLIDQATPALDKLFVKFDALDAIIKRVIGNLGKLDTVLKGQALATGPVDALAASAGNVDKALVGSIGSARTLGAELRQIAAQTAVVARGLPSISSGAPLTGVHARGARAGGGGGGGAAGGVHFGGAHMPLPGSGGMHMGGNAGLAALGLLGYGAMEEAEIRDIAARALITGQVKVDAGMSNFAAFKTLRDVIQRNAALGGFAPKEVGEAVLGSERQFAGLSFDKRMEVLNTMLPFAMQEARLKETGLKESAESLIGLSHMTGTYDTAKLPDLYRKFAYASQLTPKSLPEYTRAMSYAMPSLVGGMGMDPDTIMFLTAMNQSAGIGSSKAGTWIQAFFSRLMPQTGVDLTKSQEKHNQALRDLGLIDDKDNLTWQVKGAGGKTDWLASLLKLSPMLGEKLAGMPEVNRMQIIDQIFGKQGGREAGLTNLPEFIGQFPKLARQLKMAQGGEDVLEQLGDASPVMQTRKVWSDLQNVLMDIGTVVLPAVLGPLRGFDDLLKTIAKSAGAIDKLLGHSPESDKLVSNRGFWGLSSAWEHLKDAWAHISGPQPGVSSDPMSNLKDIEQKRKERARALNPLADLPSAGATEKAGAWPPGITADMFGGPSGASVVHDGVLQALKEWSTQSGGDGGGGGGGSDGTVLRSIRYGAGRGGGLMGAIGGGIAGNMGGDVNTRALRLMRILMGKGWTAEGAASAAAEAYGESAITAGGPAGDGGRSRNMFQWDARRYSGFTGDPKNFEDVVNFFDRERKLHGQGNWHMAKTIEEGVLQGRDFEQYRDKSGHTERYRASLARAFLKLLQNPGSGDVTAHKFRPFGDRFIPPVGVDSSHDKFSALDLTMPRRGAANPQTGHVYLEGRKVGKVMWGELHRAVQGPSVGSQTPDGSRGHYGSGSSYNVSFA